ncbi:MAG TPA: CDP-diacylglycerol--serine O-phosphatidyltransferase [Sedimentisphaerales bacterium]|nr:CDP-diacylglycerol--serine O-phosphatidyltransferase [Sedimentisphaerales bacterium]
MSRQKTEAAGRRLLRRVRRQRLKYITILPSLVTTLNGVCGFTAIVFASKSAELSTKAISAGSQIPFFTFGPTTYFALAGYMILLAMIADMLDGRLARKVKSTSSFGGQLDSLCDIVSFGVAPAFLMLKTLENHLNSIGFGDGSFLHRSVWLAAAAYMSCAAIRLARFNVENEEDESAHMSFIGLPSPAAAGVIASLIILHQEKLQTLNAILYILPFVALGISILMVSRIRYPHLPNQYLRGKKPFSYLIRVLLLLAFVWWNIQVALVAIFCGFAAISFTKWLYFRVLVPHLHAKWRLKSVRDDGDLVPGARPNSSVAVAEQGQADPKTGSA